MMRCCRTSSRRLAMHTLLRLLLLWSRAATASWDSRTGPRAPHKAVQVWGVWAVCLLLSCSLQVMLPLRWKARLLRE